MRYAKVRKRNKDGHRNKLETDTFKYLSKIKDIENVSYEGHVLSYTLQKNYVPDFIIRTRSGKTIYIETKGWFRPEDRVKMAAVKRSNPELDIRLVFAKDGKINKHSEMKYSDWSYKYKFPYCIGHIPKEWFK